MSVRSKPNRVGEAPAEPERDASELPEGWAWASLSDVTDPVPNIKPEDEPDREFNYVDISSICNETFRITDTKAIKGADAPSRARRPVQPNDTLFSNVRTYLRNIALVDDATKADVCSTGFTVLRPDKTVDPRYLFRYALSDAFIDVVSPHQTGTHYPATSDRAVLAQRIALAPLAEQRRIVGKLELLLGKVSSSQQRLSRVPGLLKRFRQSVLAAACSGKLTADWREENDDQDAEAELRAVLAKAEQRRGTAEPTEGRELLADAIPSSWQLPRIEEVFRIIDYRGRNPEKAAHGKRIITAKNIRMGYLSDEPVEFVSDETYAEWMTRGFPRKDDILFVTEGATMGFVALNTRDDEFALAQRTLTLQPFDETLSTKAFFYFTMSKLFQDLVVLNATGSAAVGIKGAKFRDLPIPFPLVGPPTSVSWRVVIEGPPGDCKGEADPI